MNGYQQAPEDSGLNLQAKRRTRIGLTKNSSNTAGASDQSFPLSPFGLVL
jgi:hypothetical protein